ncbi:flavin-containing monooxygenase [Leucobacter luti]|uniref:Putative flavoprotein involved in K+ transport n=1 Tax=Leucobacter luti TaxID=340320 RepID=A0A4Q7U069_9MICO|nr:NAD(P)/FAD-dependent oxidoreductase [Leucobacter luti]MBL3699121.1 FAD-dependent oxidoreductase [Leucobacter luti]RZT66623.1 putative flavoprotein involved in K+ transport [Leucobacter luti]
MSSQEIEATEVLIVGGGQAGVAMSEHLSALGVAHVVLERHRVAERWRSERWDSLVANGPAWHDRFPGLEFEGVDPDAFATKDRVAQYIEDYAAQIGAPVRTGVEVQSVRRLPHADGFHADTSAGPIRARYVVAATGAFQIPAIPPLVPEQAGLTQIHSAGYRNPAQLPAGGVLVVGAGSSGVQIANELRQSGREVTLAVGPHDRPPQRYRDRSFVWWLGVLGKWDAATPAEGAEHVTIAVSGADGGRTIDFRNLAADGITLVGRANAYADGVMRFGTDLATNIRGGDENYLALLDEADAYIERLGLDLPEEPAARELGPDPASVTSPILELDLARAGITSIVWATGFRADYGWLQVNAFDEVGRPVHQRGVSPEAGVYFLGLPWQSRRGSSFIWGVWHDAKYLADQIAIQQGYRAYRPAPHLTHA